MAIDDIVNNSRFGELYRSNNIFRGLFNRYKDSSIFGGVGGLSSLLTKMKVHTTENGGVSYSYDPMGETRFSSIKDARDAAMFNRGLNSTRTYRATGEISSSVGGYTNQIAQHIASMSPGSRVNISNYSPTNIDDYNWMQQQRTGSAGEIFGFRTYGGDGNFQLLDVITKSGNRMTSQEIMDLAQIRMTNQGAAFKRAKVITNDRILAITQNANDPILALTFDPRRVIEADSRMKTIAEGTARRMFESQKGNDSFDTVLNRVYATMTDGMSFQTQGAFNREMNANISRGRRMIAEAESRRPKDRTSQAYAQYVKDVNDGKSIIATAERQKKMPGGTRNVRVLGAKNPLTGAAVDFGKGDQHIISDEMARAILGENHSSDFLNHIGIIMPQTDIKTEFQMRSLSYKSLETHGIAHEARSNILTAATYQDILDPQGYLLSSTKNQISSHIASLRSGNITPALRKTLDEIRDWSPDVTEGRAAQTASMNGRKFINRLDAMIKNGQDITTDPEMTGELFNAISNHYTRYRKGKFGKTFQLGGEAVPYYEMGFPMENSVRAHMISKVHPGQGRTPRRGMIEFANNTFHLHGNDIVQMTEAMGGSDLDDELYAMLRYDPQAKRLLAFTLRDPNEMGEYMIFDAHHSLDRHAPLEVKQLWTEHDHLLAQIGRGKVDNKKAKARLDSIRNELDAYYREAVPQMDAVGLMTPKNGRPARLMAPKGYETIQNNTAFRQGGYLNSLRTSEEISGRGSSTQNIRNAMKAEYAGQTATDVAGSLYRYRPGYDEYHQTTGYFQESAKIKAMEVAAGNQEIRPLSVKDGELRDALELRTRGLLGKDVNQASIIDEFIQSNLHHGTDAQVAEFQSLLKANRFTHVNRETVIDTIKKTGNATIVDEVENIINEDAGKLGTLIGNMQLAGRARGDATMFGLDPVMYATRVASNTNAANALEAAYTKAMGYDADQFDVKHILLDGNDKRVYVSHKYQDTLNIAKEMKEAGETLRVKSAQNLQNRLGDLAFMPEEMSRASSLIDNYQNETRKMQALMDSSEPDNLLRDMLGGSDIDDFTDGNTATLRALHEMGVVGNDEVDRQLLAVAQLATENYLDDPDSRAGFGLLRSVGGPDEFSVADIYNGALNRQINTPRLMREIGDISTHQDLMDLFADGTTLNQRAKTAFDPVERNLALLGKIEELSKTNGRTKYMEMAQTLMGEISASGQMPREEYQKLSARRTAFFRGQTESFMGEMPQYRPARAANLPPPGARRLGLREAADEVADGVSAVRSVRTRIREFDGPALQAVMSIPMLRRGIIGAGLLAGFGILHRLAKDPSPEEMEGPPLLPGGGPYDDVPDINPLQAASMYSSVGSRSGGGSMMYQIQASGDFDSSQVSSGLSRMTGTQVRGTIYQGRQTTSGRPSARNLLSTLMGG